MAKGSSDRHSLPASRMECTGDWETPVNVWGQWVRYCDVSKGAYVNMLQIISKGWVVTSNGQI